MAVRTISIGLSLLFLIWYTNGQRPCPQEFADDYLYNVLKGPRSTYNPAMAPEYPGILFTVKDAYCMRIVKIPNALPITPSVWVAQHR